ncbi:hypothetical protein CKF54_07850 [Psittacicella hinzii]|uniref:Uncharacterized protein n=1 Tax=Psittacicella hinzii TaxID=2028575 RepID=A0A3A1XYH3_9GAMM|nr:hypothetical protein [Psittacicella hinzii]RIY31072.1 hypothetical protein CKF54_07850 [Psittacicella hinzii]
MKTLKKAALVTLVALTGVSFASASTGLSSLKSAASSATSSLSSLSSLSSSDQSLLKQITSGSLSNSNLTSLLSDTSLNSYVKNAATLKLAQNYIGESNLSKAKSVLSYFNSSSADSTQTSLYETLKSKVGL